MATAWNDVAAGWDQAVEAVRADAALPARVHVEPLRWWRGSVPIAITGTIGCGKTLMYDALMDAIDFRFELPSRSDDWERHRVKIRGSNGRTRASVIVVPGHPSTNRDHALERIFGERRSPVGLIHVVCWGYNHRWDLDADKEFEERVALLDEEHWERANEEVPKAIRRDNLSEELRDFRDLCRKLMLPGVRRRLQWMIIAVAKSDLYWSDLAGAREYYVPVPSGPPPGVRESGFCRALRRLAIGPAFPERLAIVPFAGYLDPHYFGNDTKAQPQLSSQQVASVRNNFCNVLGGLL